MTTRADAISTTAGAIWQADHVTSPQLPEPVEVIVARNVPYIQNANRFQNLTVYLPATRENRSLVGQSVTGLPDHDDSSNSVRYQVHIHGGAWRDPELTSASVEPAVAHTYAGADREAGIRAVATINYTITQFPTHPRLPYDAIKDNHTDSAREAVHPQHVSDVLHGFGLLRSFGLSDGSYVLSGHSCGACLCLQALLQAPAHYGLTYLDDPPCPAALVCLNGLYDLPALVHGLGPSHESRRDDYEMFLSNAFGADQSRWPEVSPASFDPTPVAARLAAGRTPALIVLDQSTEDQLVPMNQRERLETILRQVHGLRLVRGHRATGRHAQAWEQGDQVRDSVQDAIALLTADHEKQVAAHGA